MLFGNSKPDDENTDAGAFNNPRYQRTEQTEIGHSDKGLTVGKLIEILGRVPADATVMLDIVDVKGDPLGMATVVGVGMDQSTGDVEILGFPGTLDEWRTGA